MADQNVKIIYEAVVRGQERLEELVKKNQELQGQTEQYKQKLDRLSQAQEKHTTVLRKAGSEIRNFRREMFAVSAVIGFVAAGMNLMSKGSENVARSLETAQRSASSFFGAIGNKIAQSGAFLGALSGGASFSQAANISKAQIAQSESFATTSARLNLESQTARLRGDDLTSILKRQEAERTQLLKDAVGYRQRKLMAALKERQEAEIEAFRLERIGLKNQLQIQQEFLRGTVGALRGGLSDTIFNFLQGEKQTGADVLKNFTTGLNRAISEAFTQSLFTTFASGGNFFENFKNLLTGRTPAVIAAERAAKAAEEQARRTDEMIAILNRIAECACSTAQRLGAGFTATITPPKKSALDKAAAVAGGIGSIANSLAGLPGFGGGGGAPQPPADVIMGQGPLSHSGGFVRPFQSGGEVPITAQPGEFIVRRSAAQENKDLLRDINNGGKAVRGTQNVFLIKTNDAASFANMLSTPSSRGQLEIQIIRAIQNNGQIRSVIKEFAR